MGQARVRPAQPPPERLSWGPGKFRFSARSAPATLCRSRSSRVRAPGFRPPHRSSQSGSRSSAVGARTMALRLRPTSTNSPSFAGGGHARPRRQRAPALAGSGHRPSQAGTRPRRRARSRAPGERAPPRTRRPPALAPGGHAPSHPGGHASPTARRTHPGHNSVIQAGRTRVIPGDGSQGALARSPTERRRASAMTYARRAA